MKYALGDSRVITESDEVWIAPNAVVIGRVRIGRNASIWWNSVVRGDFADITIGRDTNIQDGSVLHVDFGAPLTVGNGVTVGHMAMIHGCEIGDNTLIGIGSIILNHAKIGPNCLIAANTLITERKEIPEGSLVMGSPGKVVRQLAPEEIEGIRKNTQGYVNNWKRYVRDLAPDDELLAQGTAAAD